MNWTNSTRFLRLNNHVLDIKIFENNLGPQKH